MEFDWTTTATIRDGNVVAWFEEVGPERAKELLKTYKTDYRKFRPVYADGLARDKASGNWHFDGSPIRIDEEGNLFDGQHRLHSDIIAGTTTRYLFIAGLPVAAYNTTDTGLARTYGDTLRRRGFQNVNQRTALIKLIDRWERGVSLDDTARKTPSELDSIHDRHVDTVTRAVQMSMSTSKKIFMSQALVAFAWWLLGSIENEQCFTFMVTTAEGENIGRGNPMYTLRERLRNDYENGHTRNEYIYLVIQAWNAYRKGNKIERLQLPSGMVTRDKMVNPL